MMQILKATPATLELKVYSSGTLTNLDANPTLAATDANGDALSPGTITTPSTGVYRSVLPAQAELTTLTAVWTGALSGNAVSFTQHHEVVGNHLFTEADARGARFTGQQSPLADEDKFSDEVVARMRELITQQFEQKTGRSWIRRYCRMELHGGGGRELRLFDGHPRDVNGNESGGEGRLRKVARLISVSVDGTVVDLSEVALHGRSVFRKVGTWPRATASDPFRVVVEYEYGDDPVDLEARENGLRVIVANLVPSDVPDYAQTLSVGGENYSFQQNDALRGMLRTFPEKTREWLDRNPAWRIPGVA
jgi:hypothetical protein